jgi:type II secretion system protein I
MNAHERRSGLTLLEVILALAILAGSLAALGELAGRSMRNAEVARATSEAQLLCETKLAEIAAGITPADPVSDAPWQSASDLEIETSQEWLYSVEVKSTDLDGLLSVRVTVRQDRPREKKPVSVTLVRWIVDPGLEAGTE